MQMRGRALLGGDKHAAVSVQIPRRGDVSRHSSRLPKNPKDFKSMDQLRDHLQNGESSITSQTPHKPGFIAGALNAISQSAFGYGPDSQPWWSFGRIYRWATSGLGHQGRVRRRTEKDPVSVEDPADPLTPQIDRMQQSMGPLLLLPRRRLRRLARRFPPVLNMSAADVGARVLHMKDALPGADVVYLMEQYPQLFLAGTPDSMATKLRDSLQRLRVSLAGANITAVVMSEPEILFMDLEYGLGEMKDLWDVSEEAMMNSEPHELAFAVKSLCLTKTRD